jgi:hypothetical protein
LPRPPRCWPAPGWAPPQRPPPPTHHPSGNLTGSVRFPFRADRRSSLRAVVSLTAAWATAGCAIRVQKGGEAGARTGDSNPGREVARIDVDAAQAAVLAGRAVLVDVRGPESYSSQRAAGALLLPL